MTESSIKIIKADYSDSRQAHEIAKLLNAYATDPMGGGKELSPGVMDTLAMELSRLAHAFSIIAYVDDEPAGLVNCFEVFSTFQCKPVINIHDVVVLQDFRGMGLGKKLLEKVENIARERGCCKLTLEVLSGNEVAAGLYRKYGFTGYELDPDKGTAQFLQKML